MSKLKKEYGTVDVAGQMVYILQNPYLDGDVYRSVGMTDEQIEAAGGLDNIVLPCDPYYRLTWEIINPRCDDESEACDWDDATAELCK